MKVSKRFGSQKTDLLSVIRLDARIIVRWTKMEMRFEIKRGKKKKKKKRKSNLVSLFGTIFYANVTRNETKSSLNQRLRIEGGDKEKQHPIQDTGSVSTFCPLVPRGSHECVVLSSNSVLDATFHYVVRSNSPSYQHP